MPRASCSRSTRTSRGSPPREQNTSRPLWPVPSATPTGVSSTPPTEPDMADSIHVDAQRIAEASAGWYAMTNDIASASFLVEDGLGQGEAFGELATLAGIPPLHNELVSALNVALGDALSAAGRISRLLEAVAHDFGVTDDEIAEAQKKIQSE